ncbi:YciI family protein [Cryptosporangium phraense]|uniref:YciI family protein n=1 Tax=Cryptosporangium phraense TaxID=2593070 RepID=A0A545AZ34_9ACTN|nr:YciI family protein [Cryptosporangium phraense]TQS46596.1 YciI family protein [Cryptosporangium phraense]
MKYLVLIYGNPLTWAHPIYLNDPAFLALPPAERAAIHDRAEKLRDAITESGELLGGEMLDAPTTARTVRVRARQKIVTDGPYAETKEQLAGFVILDCATPERAAEIAAAIPDARFTGIELRPMI